MQINKRKCVDLSSLKVSETSQTNLHCNLPSCVSYRTYCTWLLCKLASKLISMRLWNRGTGVACDNPESVPCFTPTTLCSVLSGGNPKHPETKETFSEAGPGHGLRSHTVSLLLQYSVCVWESLLAVNVRNSILSVRVDWCWSFTLNVTGILLPTVKLQPWMTGVWNPYLMPVLAFLILFA